MTTRISKVALDGGFDGWEVSDGDDYIGLIVQTGGGFRAYGTHPNLDGDPAADEAEFSTLPEAVEWLFDDGEEAES